MPGAPQSPKRPLPESYWFQSGYANEFSSGIIAVVTQVDSLVTQEYLPVTVIADSERSKRSACCRRCRCFIEGVSLALELSW